MQENTATQKHLCFKITWNEGRWHYSHSGADNSSII